MNRRSSLSICILSVSALLLLSTVSCGEIEIPQKGATEQPAPDPDGNTDGTGGKEDGAGGGTDTPSGDDSGEKPDDSGEKSDDNGEKPDDSGEKPDDSGEKQGDIVIGQVCFTADSHILIADQIYLSLEEYWYVSGANGPKPDEAKQYAEAYAEGDLTGWRIPTYDDAVLLRSTLACESPYYGKEVLPQLNKVLDAHNCIGIYRERYLCDDAKKSFDFIFDGNITTTSKSKTYRLRLVRDK